MCTVQVDWSRRQCPVVINQVQPFTPTRNRIKAKTSCPVAFGGQLIVKHQTERKEFDFSGSDNSSYFHYAAFYADCIHEIKPVTHAHEYWMTIFNRQHYMYTCNYSQDCVSFSFWDIHTQCTEQYKTPLHSCYSVNTAIIMLPLVMGIVPLVAGWSSHWGGGLSSLKCRILINNKSFLFSLIYYIIVLAYGMHVKMQSKFLRSHGPPQASETRLTKPVGGEPSMCSCFCIVNM